MCSPSGRNSAAIGAPQEGPCAGGLRGQHAATTARCEDSTLRRQHEPARRRRRRRRSISFAPMSLPRSSLPAICAASRPQRRRRRWPRRCPRRVARTPAAWSTRPCRRRRRRRPWTRASSHPAGARTPRAPCGQERRPRR
eukprot:251552-Prymnesium_polylepis.2